MKLYEDLGGLEKLKQIVDEFVDKLFDDFMVGYLFRKSDKIRVKEKEFELIASVLGSEIKYTGKSVKEVHRTLNIKSGEFERRKQILKEVLLKYNCPENVVKAIMEHTEKLRFTVIKKVDFESKKGGFVVEKRIARSQ